MERFIFLGVLGFSLVAVFIAVFLIPGRPVTAVHLPWQIEISADGNTQVFGLEIGKSSLADVAHVFQAQPEVSLFEQKDGERVIEAYFDNVDISGLRARVVLVMAVSAEQLDGMYQRGERLANMGGGRHKVTLASADMETLRQMSFSSLSYIPKHNLDEKLVMTRFGEPAERITESDGKVVHWLYPDKGLDVALNPDAKEVLQYVPPSQFERVRRPLLEQAQTVKAE